MSDQTKSRFGSGYVPPHEGRTISSAQTKHAGSLKVSYGYCVVPYVGVGTSLTGGGRGAGEGGARGFVLQ